MLKLSALVRLLKPWSFKRGRGLTTAVIPLGFGGRKANYALNRPRSEEHTSELQSLMRISYAVFCLKKKNTHISTLIIETKLCCSFTQSKYQQSTPTSIT